jgi:peptide/nickel transport system substrate-binding protein
MEHKKAEVTAELRRRGLLGATGAGGLSFALGGQSALAQAPKTLNAAMTADAVSLYPHFDTTVAVDIFPHLYDTLLSMHTDGSVRPRLAQRWETPDNVQWTFHLVQNATWTDGTPVTAEDVAATFTHVATDRTLPNNYYLRGFRSAEVLGPHTVRLSLAAADATFPRWTTLIHIIPARVSGRMAPEVFHANPIGSGPYRLRSFRRDRVELVARTDYRDGPPRITNLNFISVPSESARVNGLRSGELHVIGGFSPAELAGLRRNPAVQVLLQPMNRVVYLSHNVNNGPTRDVRIRRAITLAIDRVAIAEQALEGLGSPAGHNAAPPVFGHSRRPDLAPVAADPNAARALLREAGYAREEIVLTYPTNGLPQAPLVAEVISGFLSAVGIRLRLEGLEWGTIVQRWRAKDFRHMLLFGFGPSILDASLTLSSLYISGSRGLYTPPEFDDVFRRQAAEVNEAARLALFEQVWAADRANAIHTFLYNEFDAYAIRRGVTWAPRPDRRMRFLDADIAP